MTSADKVRVLVNGLHAKSGGGVTYLRNILPILARDPGLEVYLCLHQSQRDTFSREILSGVSVHIVDFKLSFWRVHVWEQTKFSSLSRQIDPDVVFSPANYGPLLARNSVLLLRNALSVSTVERRPAKLLYWLLVTIATSLSLLRCKRAISVSEFASRAAAGPLVGNFIRHRMTVIPHGVDDMFTPGKPPPRREEFLLAVSDIYVQKNLLNLVLAFAEVQKTRPSLILKVAGREIDAEYSAAVKKVVADHGLEANVEFLGYQKPENLLVLYRTCLAFVFPSTVETFGNPLLEAMACGAPVVCSCTAAMPEVAGDAPEYFDPFSVPDMTAVIGRVVDDAALRETLSNKSISRASRYSWTQTAEKTARVLKEAAR
ncbi:glycosyltransferase family 1 protein [Thalassospiraceae bacterium LMO-JJ14]|nr:glycosyltransferase family 1 protein [Thalassospiraceae bacterium LMO-JJ14]